MTISSSSIVTGELHYRLFEKDSNTGVIKGEMRGDPLITTKKSRLSPGFI
ncbi:MAG: hypothetical protein KAY27_00285 [Pedobacter sp.]|nr:hypothetical protein [Pedobacter sp.]